MKNLRTLLVLVILTACYANAFSQSDFSKVQFKTAEDYKTSEKIVLEAADYILSTPFQKNDTKRLNALSLIIQWMSGTPDYQFEIDESILKLTKKNEDVLGLYMVALTKYVLGTDAPSSNQKTMKVESVKLLLAYCENPANNIKMTKSLKEFSEANAKGELEGKF